MTETNPREEKGKQIASKNRVFRMNDNHYHIQSQTSNKKYDITKSDNVWRCTCPDYTYRHFKFGDCKHIHAVEFSIKIREEVRARNNVVIAPVSISECIYCHSSKITKDGLRRNKYGSIQKFQCKDCKKYFTINIGFERMKHNPKGITTAMQLYFSGESLRNVSKSLRLMGMDVSHQTIYNWIEKYTGLMNAYISKITPQVGDTWRADEVFVKFSGNMKYLYALMDDETRYWIAQQVSDNKHKDDISQMLRDGKALANKKPEVFITDGARNFHQAHMREFNVNAKQERTIHIQHIHFKHDMNNNKMERLNGEIRDREKVMRGLKKMDTPILAGYQIFHNYFRPHMGLEGKTPSEACGIKIEGDNKWITLIQNASMNN